MRIGNETCRDCHIANEGIRRLIELDAQASITTTCRRQIPGRFQCKRSRARDHTCNGSSCSTRRNRRGINRSTARTQCNSTVRVQSLSCDCDA